MQRNNENMVEKVMNGDGGHRKNSGRTRCLAWLLILILLAGCAGETAKLESTGEESSTSMEIVSEETAVEEQTETPMEKENGLTLEQLSQEHGSLVSTTDEAITQEQLEAIYQAVEAVTLGNKDMWQLTVIPNLDLIQELLPTYAQAGLLREGNVAIIVSVTSDTGVKDQYKAPDNTEAVAAGMVAQQICVAAQMQGIGFKVITDCIRESAYTLYVDDIVDTEHLLQEGKEWEEWITQFAIPKENYYRMVEGGDPIKTINGDYVYLKNGEYTYYEADGETPAYKTATEYVKGYMTPCVVVLLGNTEEPVETSKNAYKDFVTEYDGSSNPYPENYGGSGQQ